MHINIHICANMPKLNDSKTELMLVTSKRTKHLHNLTTAITIENAQIPFKQSVNKLGFILDCHLTMNAHVSKIARTVILRLPKSSSITTHLKSLHWLPVKVRSTYKIACLCYHCHSSTAPSYVANMLHKKPLHTRITRSSSYTTPLPNRPAHSKATLGDCSFYFASSSVWNSIPNDVRCTPSLPSSKSRLKTYSFCSVYKDRT